MSRGGRSVLMAAGCAGGTLGVVVVMELVSRYVVYIPNPGVIYTLCVACCGFVAGWAGAGGALPVVMAAAAWRYTHYTTALPPEQGVAARLGVYAFGTVLTGVLVCALKVRADRALAASEGRFEALVKRAPYGIYVHSDGRIVYANEAARRMFRAATSEELVGGSIWDRIDPAFHETVRWRLGRLHEGLPVPLIDERHVALDGHAFDTEVVAARCEFERRPAVLVIVRDVSARRAMERRIERQLSDLSLLHEVSRAMLFGMTSPEIAQYVTALVVDRLGVATAGIAVLEGAEAVLSGERFTWSGAALSPPCCAGADADVTRRALGDAGPVVWGGGSAGAEGGASYRAMAAFPLISADRVIGVLNVYAEAEGYFDAERSAEIQALANLTAIALSEAAGRAQVRRRAADLEVAVDRRTAELRAAVDELETFAYSVSHDLRAPLRAITGFAEIVVRRYSGDLHPEAGRYLDHVLRASEHMGRLIDDLLQYARLGRGGIELQAIEVSEVVSLALGDLEPVVRRTGGVVRAPADSCRVRADRTLLRRIVTNLVENALTYARPGVPPEVEITCERNDGGVYVGVRDNGIGISAEHHGSIFNLFQRLHAQEEIPGTGIGLAVVRRSAQLLGGRVGVESEPGRGSRFWVFLPAGAAGGPAAAARADGAVSGTGSAVRIET